MNAFASLCVCVCLGSAIYADIYVSEVFYILCRATYTNDADPPYARIECHLCSHAAAADAAAVGGPIAYDSAASR